MNTFQKNIVIAVCLIFFSVILRLLPHPANFAPIAAVALFSGFYFAPKYSWIIPVVSMLISDAMIGWYYLPVMLSVYSSFVIIALIGTFLKKNKGILH